MAMRALQASWLDEPVGGGRSMRPGFGLPVGTVTLLLTDIAGSTRSWESAPTAMSAAVARHYELLDAAITAHNGVRPVEQGEGDSVVAAFARASDAVAAALDAQRSLQIEPWPDSAALQVRMAVHTGEAELRDEGNYFGPTVNRAAGRLAGAAARLRDEMGYVLRWPAEQQLVDTVLASLDESAFEEGRALDERAAVEYATRARGERKRPSAGWASLTPTELDVVERVARGLTNKEIATELLMGQETVKTHLRHVFDKLGVRTRAALATFVTERRARG